MRRNRLVLLSAAAMAACSPAWSFAQVAKKPGTPIRAQAPTAAEAKTFVDEAEARLLERSVEASRAGWVQSTYITDDTEVLAAKANERAINAGVDYAKRATRYDRLKLPEDVARKLQLLKNGLTLAAPSNPKESEEVTRIGAAMEGAYGKGKYCPQGKDKCLDLQDITKIMAESRDAAQLLGNMWAQDWSNVYDLVKPAQADPGYDLTKILEAKKTDAKEMVRYGERFFTSLGFPPLPPTFWERSLFVKPRDREVVCHASAWDVDNVNDLRIKMCIEATAEDFTTIHHELGHNFYQRAYNTKPGLFRDSANDGF